MTEQVKESSIVEKELVRLELDIDNGGTIFLDVYEDMRHTVKVLQDAAYKEYVTPIDISDVSCIRLKLGSYSTETSPEELVRLVREYYCVFTREKEETNSGFAQKEQVFADDDKQEIEVVVTRHEELEELLRLLQYSSPVHDNSVFRKNYIDSVSIVDKDGAEHGVYIREGQLPEKFIQKFGELGK